MFIEDVLGSESKVKILRTLAEINSSFTLESLEKETKISRGILHKEVKRLENNSIIIGIRERGKLKSYRLNLNHKYSDIIINFFGLERTLARHGGKILLPTWNFLHLLVKKISLTYKEEIKALILFGSTARGAASLYSDIDLLAVLSDKSNADKLHEIVNEMQKKIKNKININLMKESEFFGAQKNDTTFIDEINKDGIKLIENFNEKFKKELWKIDLAYGK